MANIHLLVANILFLFVDIQLCERMKKAQDVLRDAEGEMATFLNETSGKHLWTLVLIIHCLSSPPTVALCSHWLLLLDWSKVLSLSTALFFSCFVLIFYIFLF